MVYKQAAGRGSRDALQTRPTARASCFGSVQAKHARAAKAAAACDAGNSCLAPPPDANDEVLFAPSTAAGSASLSRALLSRRAPSTRMPPTTRR